MSRELFWLTLTAIMTGLMWTPYIVDRMGRGLMGTMDNTSPNAKPHSSRCALTLSRVRLDFVDPGMILPPLRSVPCGGYM